MILGLNLPVTYPGAKDALMFHAKGSCDRKSSCQHYLCILCGHRLLRDKLPVCCTMLANFQLSTMVGCTIEHAAITTIATSRPPLSNVLLVRTKKWRYLFTCCKGPKTTDTAPDYCPNMTKKQHKLANT